MPETITSTSAPWAPLQPYLESGFARAENLYQQGGPQYYPESTVAQFGGDTQNALNMFRQQAMNSQVPGAATGHLQQVLNGDYLASNPYLDAAYDKAAGRMTENFQEAVAPSIAAQYGMSGRTGSNMSFANSNQNAQQQLGDSLGLMASDMYGGNYQQERGRQMQALGMAPSIAPLDYYGASQMLNVGEMQDAKSQQNITDAFNRHMFNQERPYDNLARFQGYLGGQYGQESTRPYFDNSLAQNVGLGLTGAGVLDDVLGSTKYGGIGGLLASFF